MGRETEDQRRGREADALSDFRAFLMSFRNAAFYAARGMDDHAAPHLAAAHEEGRHVLSHLHRRDVTAEEAEQLLLVRPVVAPERP